MKKQKEYMQDDNGNKSSIRLISIISLVASILICLLSIYLEAVGKNSTMCYYFAAIFLINSTCPKVIQKYIEMRFIKKQ